MLQMKSRTMPRWMRPMLGLSMLTLAGFWLMGCGGATSNSLAAGAPMLVTVGDAPLSNILSARVTISALSLTPTSGAATALISKPRTVELSELGATREPLELEDIPAATYNSLALTVSAASATYVNSSGQTVTTPATLGQATVTVALNPPLAVSGTDGQELQLDFDLAQSFDLTNNVLTFTPAISSAAAAVDSEKEAEKQVEASGAVISISATSITVQSADSGAQFTFTINSATQFAGTLTPATIQPGAIVEVHGVVQSDGSLAATAISAELDGEAENQSQMGATGIVTAVTTDSSGAVTGFTLVPREDFSDQSDGLPLTVTLDSSTIYNIGEDATQNGITAAEFTNAEIFPGQALMVMGTLTGSDAITAQEVDLAAESIGGQLVAAPQGSAPNFTFALQLASSSYLTTYENLTALNAATDATTEYGDALSASTFGTTAAGTALSLHGYLLRDSSGNFLLYAAEVAQTEQPETPESDSN